MEPFCVGNHAVELAQLPLNSSAAVLGCGTIGMMTVTSLLSHGVKKVIGSDVSEVKQEFALTQGVTHAFNPKKENIVSSVLSATGGIGVDAVFIAAAFPEVMDQATDISRRGAKIIMIALFEDPVMFDFRKIVAGERIVGTSFMYTRRDYDYTLEQYKKGNIDLLPLVTKKISFGQAGKVIDELAVGEHSNEIKIIIDYTMN
jgi:L-iditol 2-dehydrogenase